MLILVSGCTNKYQQISLNKAKEKIENGAYLVDVRSNNEYKKNHIKGAINIPVDEIKNQKRKIISKNDTIIVYCQSGTRSKKATIELIEMGYNHVYDFGSINNWK